MTIDVFHLFAASKENVIDTLRGTRHESEKHNDAMTCMHSSCFHSNDPPLPISRPLSVSDCVVSWLEWYRQKEVCRWKGCFFDLDMTHYYNATDWLLIRLASRVSLLARRGKSQTYDVTATHAQLLTHKSLMAWQKYISTMAIWCT